MHYVDPESIHIDVDILPFCSVHNLGVTMHGNFSKTTDVETQVRSCFYSLCQIHVIQRSLITEAIKMLVSDFICSQIDYCNAVFAIPRPITIHLDSVLHAAVWLMPKLCWLRSASTPMNENQVWETSDHECHTPDLMPGMTCRWAIRALTTLRVLNRRKIHLLIYLPNYFSITDYGYSANLN